MAKITVLGRLGADAKVQSLKNDPDRSVLNFSVAENIKLKDSEKTQWFNCSYFVKSTKIVRHLKKGNRVLVFGDLAVVEFRSPDNRIQVSNEILIHSLQLIDFDESFKKNDDGTYTNSETGEVVKSDDLPF